MLSTRNIQFSKLLKVEGRIREFNFRKSGKGEQAVFNVDVTDDRSNRIFFRMQKDNNVWKIQGKDLPGWVISNESNFCELIENELQS